MKDKSVKTNTIDVIIVDDIRLSRIELVSLLREYDFINILGEADSVSAALDLIDKGKPDLIFLDIEMPGETGFELISQIDSSIKIVFVTAYNEYAIKAFDVNALDYLLKPVMPDRLDEALKRYRSQRGDVRKREKNLSVDDRIFLTVNNQYRFIKVNTILTITASGDYTNIITNENVKGLVNKSMNEWETRLPQNHFCRIHRATIINLDYVDRIQEWFENSYRVYLKGFEEPFIISRRYFTKIRALLG